MAVEGLLVRYFAKRKKERKRKRIKFKLGRISSVLCLNSGNCFEADDNGRNEDPVVFPYRLSPGFGGYYCSLYSDRNNKILYVVEKMNFPFTFCHCPSPQTPRYKRRS
jgi:hypothetical protein